MIKVKIYGAGSIGNHLAQACRRMDWDVTICDLDPMALKRTKEEIYPSRYGKWDGNIKLCTLKDVPQGKFDVIFIGTPPDVRIKIAMEALKEKPRVLQLEKPICAPSLEMVQEFFNQIEKSDVIGCVGFDHAISQSVQIAENILRKNTLGEIETIDVEFREHWGGIFTAHSWLSGPQDTYLGFWKRGGGASGEHSHATNLFQHFANITESGRIVEVTASMEMMKNGNVEYDKICSMTVKTEKGLLGRIIQDVVTEPSRKWAKIQGKNGYLEWHCNWTPEGDMVIYQQDGYSKGEIFLPKKRPDDFFCEVLHIKDLLEGKIKIEDSPISLQKGLDTALTIACAHRSNAEKRVMNINYSKGYTNESIVPSK